MANIQINVDGNGLTTLATAGKYCDRNIDINVNVPGGMNAVPSYWKTYLESKATEINNAINAASANRAAFLWYTDAHWTSNYGQSPTILKYLNNNTGMKKTFFGGDISVAESGEIAAMTAWRELVKDIPNHHSVMGNHDCQITDLSTAPERADFFIMPERTGDMVIGTNATYGKMYYYIDNHIEKTRYICLSTGRMWTSSDEVAWCISALNSTPKDWHIVVISHLWLNNDYTSGGVITTPVAYTQGYLDMFDAYNYRLSGTESYTSTAYDFSDAGGKVEFIMGGHVHTDYDFTTTKGIPVILTECDGWEERDSASSATRGTTSENCVYAVVADFDARQVKVINVGRGDTRTKTIPKVVTYTNVLETAGYTPNTRISYAASTNGSTFEDKAATGWCASGLIPAVAGDVIRLKNCTFTVSNPAGGSHRGGIYGANADGTYSGAMVGISGFTTTGSAAVVFDDTGDNIIQFKVPSSIKSPGYVRICVQNFNENSIVTVNEEID